MATISVTVAFVPEGANIGGVAVRFVYEPTAAAVACLHEHGAFDDPPRHAGPILVVDWGGGTVDVSLMELGGNGVLYDLNTGGREDGIGGTDMDEHLLKLAIGDRSDLARSVGEFNRSQRASLLSAIERFKIQGMWRLDLGQGVADQQVLLPAGAITLTQVT